MAVAHTPQEIAYILAEVKSVLRVMDMYMTAVFAIMIYDWLVCLEQEYDVIWKTKMSALKVLYIITRYGCLIFFTALYAVVEAGMRDVHRCARVLQWFSVLQLTYIVAGQLILALRISAVWNRNRWLLGALVTILIGEFFTCAIIGYHSFYPAPRITDRMTCNPLVKGAGMVYWIFPLCYDTIATALLVGKCFVMRKDNNHGLLRTLIKQGLFAYATLAVLNWINIIFTFIPAAETWDTLNGPMTLVAGSILTCRICLLLRQQGPAEFEANPMSALGTIPTSIATQLHIHLPTTSKNSGSGSDSTLRGVIPRDPFGTVVNLQKVESSGEKEVSANPFDSTRLGPYA